MTTNVKPGSSGNIVIVEAWADTNLDYKNKMSPVNLADPLGSISGKPYDITMSGNDVTHMTVSSVKVELEEEATSGGSGFKKHMDEHHCGRNPGDTAITEDHSTIVEQECKMEDLTVAPLNSGCQITAKEEYIDDVPVENGDCPWKEEVLEEHEQGGPSGECRFGLDAVNVQHTSEEREANISYFKDTPVDASDALKVSVSLEGLMDAKSELQEDETPVNRNEVDVMAAAPVPSGEKRQSCDLCGYKPNRPDRLKYHMRSHTGEKPFACGYCNFKSRYKSDLTKHVRSHSGEKPFSCSVCEFRTGRASTLKTHMKIHIREMPFKCEHCDYLSSSADALQDHTKTHGEKPFSCDLCDFTCTEGGSLKKHMSAHTGEKRFACNSCEYRTSSSSHLKSHMMTHSGEKPFACHLCDYTCRVSTSLRRHMRTHTGEKPFACPSCEYRSNERSNVHHHMKTHTGEKPFKCEFCVYRSSNATNLRNHVRRHTDEKLFVCEVCKRRFREAGTLKRHMKTHTKKKRLGAIT